MSADVIHDPRTDWCACEPGGFDRCSYRLLADAVGDALNPPDGDEAEEHILITAVEQARDWIAAQPCACTPASIDDREPCGRCRVLGRLGDKQMQR